MKVIGCNALLSLLVQRANLAVALLAVAIGPACATVNPEPFAQFAKSVEQLRDGADKALEANVSAAHGRFLKTAVRSTGESKSGDLDKLTLKVGDDPLRWEQQDVPLFLEAELFRQSVTDMNTVFLRYAQSLVQLTSPSVIPKEQFAALTEELNANARASYIALGGKEPDDGKFALFSTLGMEAAHQYLECQRTAELREALEQNQSAVNKFAEAGKNATLVAALHAKQEYTEQADELRAQVWKDGNPASGPAGETLRRQAIQALIDLARKYMGHIDTLRALHDGIGALQIGRAHV